MVANSFSFKKIEKPTIIITSLGRTGTKFFQALFNNQFPESSSHHEPDVFNYFQYEKGKERTTQVLAQVKEVGFFNLFIRKPLGHWSLINISDARVCGAMDYSRAVKKAYNQRYSFVTKKINGSPYIESNAGYYGLLDILEHIYEEYRAVYIVRDGRDWIQSKINWGQMYGKSRLQSIFAHTWPTAYECGEMTLDAWETMSTFEKLCWAWVRLNEFAIDSIGENPHIRLVKFEDIFTADDRYQNLTDMINFLKSINSPGLSNAGSVEGWLDKRIHGSKERFPKWVNWSTEQSDYFQKVCGPLMHRLKY